MKRIALVVHVAVYPVTYVVDVLHVKQIIKSKKTVKVSIGLFLMGVGATMAINPWSAIPHVIWDALAYGIHGYGALPIFKIVSKKLDLEHLDD
jgi:hypothetical protein